MFFHTSGIDNREIRDGTVQARKAIACLNGILCREDIAKRIECRILLIIKKHIYKEMRRIKKKEDRNCGNKRYEKISKNI